MYNNLQAAEKENYNPNKEKVQCHQRGGGTSAPKMGTRDNASKSTVMQTLQAGGMKFRKYCFELKEN